MHDNSTLDQIALSHGQARWVLRHFNLSSRETDSSFDALLKSWRRDGLPFSKEELGEGAGSHVIYHYEHLMEIALALAFRTQGILSKDFVNLIKDNRQTLWVFFRRAYLERDKGLGGHQTLFISSEGQETPDSPQNFKKITVISGTYLDLAPAYLIGRTFINFRCALLSPEDAVKAFMVGHENLYPRFPLPLSDMAMDLVELATGQIPDVRRGRPKNKDF